MTRIGTKTPSDKGPVQRCAGSRVKIMDAQILVNENVNHEELPKRLTDDSYIDRFFSFKQYEQSKLKQVVLGGGLIFLVLLLTIILGKTIVCLRNGVL